MTKIRASLQLADKSYVPFGIVPVRTVEGAIRKLGLLNSETSPTGFSCPVGSGTFAVIRLDEIEDLPSMNDRFDLRTCIDAVSRSESIALQNCP